MAGRQQRAARGAAHLEHRAENIDASRVLDPVSHLAMLREWSVTCPRFIHTLEFAGIGLVRHLGFIVLDHRLITALVERWYPQSNTFVLPVGEMTITLLDVAVILGVRVDGPALIGPPVVGPGCQWESWPDCCDQLLGEHPIENFTYHNPHNPNESAQFKMGQAASQTCLPLRWLKWRFCRLSYENLTIVQVEQCVRAYILYTIGCFLMPDTSGCEVHLQWLPLMENLTLFSQYSIGGAVLAHLYRELSDSVRPSRTNIAGCLLLLQVWSWEHIYIGRPTMYVPGWSEVFGMPLGYRWNEGWTREHPMNTLVYYRNEFDTLQQGQVTWEPYTDDIFNTLPAICRAGEEIWRARVPLICWVRVEWYLPDRVMRQFGCQQHIDLEFIPTSFKRVDARGKAGTNWLHYHRKECNLWDRRRDFVIQPQLVDRNPRRALSIYMTWYKTWARLYLVRVPAEEPDTYYPRAAIEREYEQFYRHTVATLSPIRDDAPIDEWKAGKESIMSLADELAERLHLSDYQYSWDQPTHYPSYDDVGPSYAPYAYAETGPSQHEYAEAGPSQTQNTQLTGWVQAEHAEVQAEPQEEGDQDTHRRRQMPDRYTPGSDAIRRRRRRGRDE